MHYQIRAIFYNIISKKMFRFEKDKSKKKMENFDLRKSALRLH